MDRSFICYLNILDYAGFPFKLLSSPLSRALGTSLTSVDSLVPHTLGDGAVSTGWVAGCDAGGIQHGSHVHISPHRGGRDS